MEKLTYSVARLDEYKMFIRENVLSDTAEALIPITALKIHTINQEQVALICTMSQWQTQSHYVRQNSKLIAHTLLTKN